jgi:hypothetical protein
MIIIDAPPNKPGHVIDQIWAVISTDDQGEGLVAGPLPPFGLVPFIAADQARLDSVVAMARQFAQQTGRTFTLIKLSRRDVVGTINRDGLTRAG